MAEAVPIPLGMALAPADIPNKAASTKPKSDIPYFNMSDIGLFTFTPSGNSEP